MPVSFGWSLFGITLVLLFGWGWYSSGLLLTSERMPIQVLLGAYGLPFEEVSFSSEDGISLNGWFVPASVPSDKTIVLCHGWGANRSDILPHTIFLNKQGGYNLFYFDFRNHGDSAGDRSSLVTLESRDLKAALRFLRETKPAEAKRLAIYGLSMGGAVSIRTAAEIHEFEAVVAESPYSSFDGVITRFARLFYHLPKFPLVHVTLFFIKARLGLDPEKDSPVRHVGQIAPRPLFLIQGDQDRRMPVSEGESLFAAAKEPKALWTVPGADHGESAQMAGKEYEDRVLEFYRKAFERNVGSENH